jgi:hypothetical protein
VTDRIRVLTTHPPIVKVTRPDGTIVPHERKPRRPRKPTLVTVAKQASKAGIEVRAYEVKPDGSIVVVAGKVEPEPMNDLDKWIAKRHAN